MIFRRTNKFHKLLLFRFPTVVSTIRHNLEYASFADVWSPSPEVAHQRYQEVSKKGKSGHGFKKL